MNTEENKIYALARKHNRVSIERQLLYRIGKVRQLRNRKAPDKIIDAQLMECQRCQQARMLILRRDGVR